MRVLEEKRVLLSKEGVTGLAAVLSSHVTQLQNTRYEGKSLRNVREIICFLKKCFSCSLENN